MPDEDWLPVVGFEGDYEVSSLGRIRSAKNRTNSKAGTILRTQWVGGRTKVLALNLWRGNVRHSARVHVMVAEAFTGPRPFPKAEVNHKDLDRANNAADNLEWCTRRENVDHAMANGRIIHGEAHPWAKLTESQVIEIRRAYEAGEGGYKALGVRFGMPWGTVRNLVKRRRWRALA